MQGLEGVKVLELGTMVAAALSLIHILTLPTIYSV